MAPKGPRSDARARAEEALRLKCRGRTWQEIADELGFQSRSSAAKTVKRLMLREPPEDVITARAYTVGAYRQSISSLFRQLEKAEAANDTEAVIAINRAIAYVADKNAQLTGQKIPVTQEVDHNVTLEVNTSASAVLDSAEKDLLAIAAGHRDAGRLPVLDAEVVSVS